LLAELRVTYPQFNIEILGVNALSQSSYNTLATSGRGLAWLQDTEQSAVWDRWKVTYRDVQILGPENTLDSVYNLSTYDLGQLQYRDALKKLFIAAARAADSDGDRMPDLWERKYFGAISAQPTADADSDGFDNRTEFAFGSNPVSSASFPRIQPALRSEGGKVFTGRFRRWAGNVFDYRVETTSDFKQWSLTEIFLSDPLRNLFDGTGTGEMIFTAPAGIMTQPSRYMRLRAVPRPSS
jgi:hypothetical protein